MHPFFACPLTFAPAQPCFITFVKDRPGHDRHYAIDSSKIENKLGWSPREIFETGLKKTIKWYVENSNWVQSVQTGTYRDWIKRQYSIKG
ncbi:MAG: GDP-mannose 4,6-dehydratase [Proteobacteria bacterium]|nr:GDP-mannose 4,6-dehydratase [Pseudomonadota bacterium]